MYVTPDKCSDALLMDSFARRWAAKGHDVVVLGSFPHYKMRGIDVMYRGRILERERIADRYWIWRTWVYVPRFGWIVERLVNYVSFMLIALVTATRLRVDVVHVYAPPPTNGLVGLWMKWVKGARLVYMVQDVYPDVLIKLGVLRNRLLVKILQSIESLYYRVADAVTVISEGFRRNLARKGVRLEKVHVVPNGADSEFIRPGKPDTAFRRELSLGGKFVVMYAGNVGRSQPVEMLFDVARSVRHLEDIHFLVVGAGDRFRELSEECERLELKNLSFAPLQPPERIPEVLATAAVSLVMLRPGVAADSIPQKVYSIMASGRPVIASVDEGSDTWRLVEQIGAGRCVPPEEADALSQAVLELFENREEAVEMGRRGRQYMVEDCGPEAIAEHYLEIFKEVLTPERSPLR